MIQEYKIRQFFLELRLLIYLCFVFCVLLCCQIEIFFISNGVKRSKCPSWDSVYRTWRILLSLLVGYMKKMGKTGLLVHVEHWDCLLKCQHQEHESPMAVHTSISTNHKPHISPASPHFQACRTCKTRLCASSPFPLALPQCIARISEPTTAPE